MTFFAKYLNYVRQNLEGYWFKRKMWGWGWTPARWQGWAVIAGFVALLVVILVPFLKIPAPTGAQTTALLAKVGLLAAILITICYVKGEKPRWQWGLQDEETNR
jgi:high-affinity Fe2+/Pb2+ permease